MGREGARKQCADEDGTHQGGAYAVAGEAGRGSAVSADGDWQAVTGRGEDMDADIYSGGLLI